jgi:hypothetical protein
MGPLRPVIPSANASGILHSQFFILHYMLSGSESNLGKVGLCLGRAFFFTSGSKRVGGGAPMCSRAADFTAVTARNGLGFLFFAISGLRLHRHYAIIFAGGTERRRMDERDFFDERQDKKPFTLNCPHCHQAGEYELGWIVRTKKRQLPGRADERDRAKFAKARSYMVRRDDMVMCKNMRCRKRFEVSGVQSVAFLD